MAKKKKKWMQGAVKKKGSFTAWCKRQGYGGVTAACIAAGRKSKSAIVRKRASLAATFKKYGGRKRKKK